MIDRFLEGLDIDARQWRALLRVSLNFLRRKRSALMVSGRSSHHGLWLGLIVYGLMGLVFSGVVFTASSAGTAAFFLLNFVLFFVASIVLLEFGSTIVAPEDILVLGSQPVSSRTYFAAKMTMMGVIVLLYDVALGGPSIVTFGIRFGPGPAVAWMIAIVSGGLSVGLLMAVIYTTALRHVKAARMQNVMGYIQLVFSFVIYGGYVLFMGKLPGLIASVSTGQWMVVLPTRWFASIVGLASGDWSGTNILGVCLSILSITVLLLLIGGRISLTYADAVGKVAVEAGTRTRNVNRRWIRFHILRRPEDRAMAMLVVRQFRSDVKFKMSVLAIVPLTLLYLYMGTRNGSGLTDPFLGGVSTAGINSSIFLYLAMIFFPAALKDEIMRTDKTEASWVFFACPVNRGEVILSVRRVLMLGFIVPYLGLISLIFLWYFGNVLHVLMHMIVIFLMCDVFMRVLFLSRPALPFSLRRGIGDRSTTVMVVMAIGTVSFLMVLGVFVEFLYPAIWTYLLGVIGLAGLSLLLRHHLRKHVEIAGERMEFQR